MIYLYDASAIICSATYSKKKAGKTGGIKGDFNYYSFPVAGVYSLMSYVTTDMKKLKKGDSIVVAFDCSLKNNIRKQYYPEYKLNRIKYPELGRIDKNMTLVELVEKVKVTYPRVEKESAEGFQTRIDSITQEVVKGNSISIQAKVLQWMLKQIGVTVLFHENLEADDLIYSVCQKYGQEHEIFLRADDGDLHDCELFAPKFIMHSVSGRGRINTSTGNIFEKIFHGDLKDGIYSLYSYVNKIALNKLKMAICSGVYNIDILNNPQMLSEIGFTPEESSIIVKNNYLKMPKIIDVDVSPTEYDKEATEKMFSVFGFVSLLKRIKGERYREKDLKAIHENIYNSLPVYIKEWYYSRRFSSDTEESNVEMLKELETSRVVRDIDSLLEIL